MDSLPVLMRSALVREAVARLGLTFLDREWRGVTAEYRFQCVRNHVFRRTALSLVDLKACGCPICIREDRDARLFALAKAAGVECLEREWLGVAARHRFRCPCGHAWDRRGANVLCSANCPACRHVKHGEIMRNKNGLAVLQQAAAARGGVCLDQAYRVSNQLYTFRCKQGHEWKAVGAEVIRGSWCAECARLRKVIDYRDVNGLARLQQMAAKRGGVCLSDCYVGVRARYLMRCAKGHEWSVTGGRIFRGSWCAACAHYAKRLTIEDAQNSAQARGGQCLSTEYVNTATKMHWLCERGHSWQALYGSVRAGHWCAECAFMAKITNPQSKAWMRYKKSPFMGTKGGPGQ